MCPKKLYVVTLTAEERSCLQSLLSMKRTAARKQMHARILLKADTSRGTEPLTDEQVAEAVETSRPAVRSPARTAAITALLYVILCGAYIVYSGNIAAQAARTPEERQRKT